MFELSLILNFFPPFSSGFSFCVPQRCAEVATRGRIRLYGWCRFLLLSQIMFYFSVIWILFVFVDCPAYLAWFAKSCFLHNLCASSSILGWNLLSGYCYCYYLLQATFSSSFFCFLVFYFSFFPRVIWFGYHSNLNRHVLYLLMGWGLVSSLSMRWFMSFRWSFLSTIWIFVMAQWRF